jgi:CheY-like chemotaxis protein
MKLIECDYLRASDGNEAVEICRQNNNITLILMDVQMPVMNGLEATRIIHGFRPDLPVVAVTAYAQTGDEHRCRAAGCDDYLAKPVKKEKLLLLLQKYI